MHTIGWVHGQRHSDYLAFCSPSVFDHGPTITEGYLVVIGPHDQQRQRFLTLGSVFCMLI